MAKVGKGIDSAKDHYDKALSQLSGGKANLIKQAAEFKDLGVSVTKELDSSVVETAKLELPQSDNQ
jgi:DNA recombination protein RmuC